MNDWLNTEDVEDERDGEYGSNGGDGTSYIWWKRKIGEHKFPVRFFLKRGEMRKVIFLDKNHKVNLWEHEFEINGQKGGFATCIRNVNPGVKCPLCEAGNKAAKIRLFTVIDMTGYFSKKEQKQIQNYKALYLAKQGTYDMMLAKMERHGPLFGSTYEISRIEGSNNRSPRVGNDFTFMENVSEKMTEKHAAFNYKVLFNPFTIEQMEEIARVAYWRGKQEKCSGDAGNDGGFTDPNQDMNFDFDDPGALPF